MYRYLPLDCFSVNLQKEMCAAIQEEIYLSGVVADVTGLFGVRFDLFCVANVVPNQQHIFVSNVSQPQHCAFFANTHSCVHNAANHPVLGTFAETGDRRKDLF